jgi:hypothetical protein
LLPPFFSSCGQLLPALPRLGLKTSNPYNF